MNTQILKMIEPTVEMEQPFWDFCSAFDSPKDIDGIGMMRHAADEGFAKAVELSLLSRTQSNVKPGWVAQTTFWLFNDQNQMLGTIDLRHELNELLFNWGGHVGYAVHPDHRHKGYATFMLNHVLEYARSRSMDRLMISCQEGNIASEKLILNAGGIYENSFFVDEYNKDVRRHWITL
ncbi:Acetyltransferase (GNAT) family protein [Poriferisphaera corsica]|uniref:Acetyltransferase (GNAT) family protein n=1 Tax=Poriferisphaera corsica TaxID=2528020 RepID=A0A517YWZ1_9BACT|nr:GNAT family N-acetyltransferase [Poriferisphaera corsica]QDU34741.1 Acetyltransferase (GNAT) family protein [Poriferisphaera corsica]